MIVQFKAPPRAAYTGSQVRVQRRDVQSGADYLPAFGRLAPYLERA